MIAFVKLECLKTRNRKNHYAMKSETWLEAIKTAWKQLYKSSITNINFNKIIA